MSNRTLRLWYSGTLTSMLCPERAESRAWAADRWLAALLGSLSLHLGHAERRRRGRSADRVIRASAALQTLSPAEIEQRCATLRASLQAQGCTQGLVEQSFALVREVSGRTLGKRHHKVQIMGGLALLNGCLVETFLLTHWARDRKRGAKLPLEFLVRKQTQDCALAYGKKDRGVLAPGYRADINIIDFDKLGMRKHEVVYDLPSGGRRLMQRADGYRHTFVAGVETLCNDEHTGAMPGRLLR